MKHQQQKRRGRPPTGKNEMIAIRWPEWLRDGIKAYAVSQCLEQPVALRQMVTLFLIQKEIMSPEEVMNHLLSK